MSKSAHKALFLALVLTVALPLFPADVLARGHYALVIGNSAYTGTAPLKNPVNDASLIADTLKETGFTVTKLLNASRTQMRKAMLAFGRQLRADPQSVGLFYYAGHGMQVHGVNYVVPVDADIKDEEEVPFVGVDVNEFLGTMQSSKSRLNIVVLDACRNNPYARSFRSASRGLAPVRASSGTLIAYSTSPGDVAFDGKGLNSPYSLALARFVKKPGLTIERVFKKVLATVEDETQRKQTPWLTGAFRGDFYFIKKGDEAPGVSTRSAADNSAGASGSGSAGLEKLFWQSISNSSNAASYEAYLAAFPNGVFAPLAKIKISELSAKASSSKVVASARQPDDGDARNTANWATTTKGPKDGERPRPVKSAKIQDEQQLAYRYLFPDSSRREIDREKVKQLDCHKLWLARNEIYYRNHYCFKSEKGLRYFDNSNCSRILVRPTSLENRNIRAIRTWEIRKRCRIKRLRGSNETPGALPSSTPGSARSNSGYGVAQRPGKRPHFRLFRPAKAADRQANGNRFRRRPSRPTRPQRSRPPRQKWNPFNQR